MTKSDFPNAVTPEELATSTGWIANEAMANAMRILTNAEGLKDSEDLKVQIDLAHAWMALASITRF